MRISNITRDNATFQWETPESIGSSPITGYIIETKEISSDDWTFLGRTNSETTTLRIVSLIEDCYYFFRVTAENQHGRGIPLESDVPVEPSRLFDFTTATADAAQWTQDTQISSSSVTVTQNISSSNDYYYYIYKHDDSYYSVVRY